MPDYMGTIGRYDKDPFGGALVNPGSPVAQEASGVQDRPWIPMPDGSETGGGGGGGLFGTLGTAVGKAAGAVGSGLGNLVGMLGFRSPDSSALKEDKEGFEAIKGQAGILATPMGTPTVAAPDWYRPTTATAGITLGELAQARAATATPTYMNLDQSNEARAQQQALISQLGRQAAGQGPSIAQEQLRQATTANINQQLAAAKSMHGNARLAALRQAGWQGAAIQQQAASQATALRAQEIAQAQGALGNVLAGQRGQDITAATQQAVLQQQTNLTNAGYTQGVNLANAQLAQQAGQFDANALNSGNQFNANNYNQAGLAYGAQVNAGNQAFGLANLNSQLQTNQLNTQRQSGYLGTLLGAQGGIAGLDSTVYAGNAQYDAQKRAMVGGLLNQAGGALIPKI